MIEISTYWKGVMIMQKIVVKCKVTERYPVDAMRITIGFLGTTEGVRDGIEWSQEQCESFLEQLRSFGIGMRSVRMRGDKIEHNGRTQRTIELNFPADLALNACILELLRHNNYVCDYHVEYYISDMRRYQEALLTKAIEKSRLRAERIAKATGKQLLGIENVYTLMEEYVPNDCILVRPDDFPEYEAQKLLVNQLPLDTKELTEEVEVTWCVE